MIELRAKNDIFGIRISKLIKICHYLSTLKILKFFDILALEMANPYK